MIRHLINVIHIDNRVYLISNNMNQLLALGQYGFICRQFHSDLAWNLDIIFCVFEYDTQWVLGVICQTSRQIYIFDSAPRTSRYYDISRHLQVYTQLLAAAGGYEVDYEIYSIIVSNDCPKHQNKFDSGLFLCLNVYSIINSKPYLTAETLRGRKWIYSQLTKSAHKSANDRASDFAIDKKLLKELETKISRIPNKPNTRLEPTSADVKVMVARETSNESYWSPCDNETCDVNNQYVFCPICRKWFHVECKSVVDQDQTLGIYFCECSSQTITQLVKRAIV
jgi:hypothetical protein